jgi:hypothetical protein
LKDDLIPYFLQVPDLEQARLKQTEADLESLAKYRALKSQAYDAWSKSMGKEFTYYNKDGVLEKVDVESKRENAKATQDEMAGTEINAANTVRKAYRDHLSTPGAMAIGDAASLAVRNSLPGIDRRGSISSPLRWTPIPPPIDLTTFDKVCLWFQKATKFLYRRK